MYALTIRQCITVRAHSSLCVEAPTQQRQSFYSLTILYRLTLVGTLLTKYNQGNAITFTKPTPEFTWTCTCLTGLSPNRERVGGRGESGFDWNAYRFEFGLGRV